MEVVEGRKRSRAVAQHSPGAAALLDLDKSLTELFGFSPQPAAASPCQPNRVPAEDPLPATGESPPDAVVCVPESEPTSPAPEVSPEISRKIVGSAAKRRRPYDSSPVTTSRRAAPSQLLTQSRRRSAAALERLRLRTGPPTSQTTQSSSAPESNVLRSPDSALLPMPDSAALGSPSDSLFASPASETPPLPSQLTGGSEAAVAAAGSVSVGGADEADSQRRRRALVAAALQQQAEISSSAVGPFHGLPSLVPALLEKQRGISTLYAWQEECLGLPAVKQRKNLVYSLPTSGGKTLVAELLIMKELLCRKRDCMLVLPYVAIVQEKVRALAPFGLALGFLVEEYASGRGAYPPPRRRKRRVVYVCTIEKAGGLATSLLEEGRASELGLVVLDELHMLGEAGGRGATLELLVTKLKLASPAPHLVGMSATLGNMDDVAAFLEAAVYTRPFRPVRLREHVLVAGQLLEVTGSSGDTWDNMLTPVRRIEPQYTPDQWMRDPDGVGALVAEVVPDNSCLVFCPTRRNCEAVAKVVCGALNKSVREHRLERKVALYNALINEGGGTVCPTLRQTLPWGIAYHHSGLTTGERKLLEEAYLEGTLCCLCCTSTLAAGVNLPAKRVVLRSPYTGPEFLSRGRYKQMVGRAGRAGIDDSGESILMVAQKDVKRVAALLTAPLERCESTLLEREGHGVRRLLLSAVALRLADTPLQLQDVVARTLLAVQANALKVDLSEVTARTVSALRSESLLRASRRDGAPGQAPADSQPWPADFQLKVSRLGLAAVKGNVDLRLASRLYDDLRQAESALAVINSLHLLYLVTPYDMMDAIQPDPGLYLDMYTALQPEEAAVARLIGVTEAHVVHMMSGARGKGAGRAVAHRLYLTLVLHEVLRSDSLWDAANRCQLHRGQLQSLLQSTAAFSAAVLHFCKQLDELWPFVQLLDVFNKQLATGKQQELAELLQLPAVKQGRARALYSAGYKTLQDVANADPEVLVHTLEHLPRRVAKTMVDTAKMLVLERAEALQEEAEQMLDGLNSAQFHATPGLERLLLGAEAVPPGVEASKQQLPTVPPGDEPGVVVNSAENKSESAEGKT